MNEHSRNFCFDNIKGLLILLVVFGHLLELAEGSAALWIYRIIYSFHMPVFIFCSGRFARFSANRFFSKLLYPYLIYQTLYVLFSRIVLHQNTAFQYTTPHWLLWYLFSMMVWLLALPLIQRFPPRFILVCCLALALCIGFYPSVGYFLSLSRTAVFLPFFVFGYFSEPLEQHLHSLSSKKLFRLRFVFISLILFSAAALWIGRNTIRSAWFYQSLSYQQGHSNLLIRAALLALGFVWIILLLICIPSYHLPLFSQFGRYTMPIFLLHGFAVKLFDQLGLFQDASIYNIISAAAGAVGLCILLGNAAAAHLLQGTFSAEWLLKIKNMILKALNPS